SPLIHIYTLSLHDALPIFSARYFYNNDNLLIKKIIGSNSTPTTEKYSYDRLNRMTTVTKEEFNNNVSKWLTTVDSLFYDNENNRSEEHTSELQSRENLVCR